MFAGLQFDFVCIFVFVIFDCRLGTVGNVLEVDEFGFEGNDPLDHQWRQLADEFGVHVPVFHEVEDGLEFVVWVYVMDAYHIRVEVGLVS